MKILKTNVTYGKVPWEANKTCNEFTYITRPVVASFIRRVRIFRHGPVGGGGTVRQSRGPCTALLIHLRKNKNKETYVFTS